MCSDNIFQSKFNKPQMDILQFDPSKKSLWLTSSDIPQISKPDDVIVKVAYAGVCGTDLHIIAGEFPCSKRPFTLGHEFCGTIHAVGSEVKRLKRGDRVAVDPQSSCGECKFCQTGSYHICPDGALNSTVGLFRNGGWAQFCKISSKQVTKLPPSVSLKQAVLMEPLACVYHGLSQISPVHPGSKILISGAGIIGNLFSSLLHHMGHRDVVVSEPEECRRESNKKLDTGFKIVKPEELKNIFSNDGVNGIDITIECSGNGKGIETSFNLLNRGGKLLIFGVASPETKISISPFEIFLKELTIIGTVINGFSSPHAAGALEAMGSRYIDFDRLGIRVFPIKEYKDALEALREKTVSKAVFQISANSD